MLGELRIDGILTTQSEGWRYSGLPNFLSGCTVRWRAGKSNRQVRTNQEVRKEKNSNLIEFKSKVTAKSLTFGVMVWDKFSVYRQQWELVTDSSLVIRRQESYFLHSSVWLKVIHTISQSFLKFKNKINENIMGKKANMFFKRERNQSLLWFVAV